MDETLYFVCSTCKPIYDATGAGIYAFLTPNGAMMHQREFHPTNPPKYELMNLDV